MENVKTISARSVIVKRIKRGASLSSIISWLNHLIETQPDHAEGFQGIIDGLDRAMTKCQ